MAYTYDYPRPAVTADCIVMTNEPQPKVLLIQRGANPYKGAWAFLGGFMNMDETTEQCAIRELEEETGLKVATVHQIGAYSKIDRDPRGRTITVAYLAIVDKPVDVKGQDNAANAAWFPITDLPHHIINIDNSYNCKKNVRIKFKNLHTGDNYIPVTATDIRGNTSKKNIHIRLVPVRNNYRDNDYDDLENRINDLESRIEELE